jgi:hypothetical protein
MTPFTLARIALLGALGGALNASLCYFGWPVPAAGDVAFSPWIIAAGAAHGALLATGIVSGEALLRARALPARLALIPLGGWIIGWLSFIPIHLEIFFQPVTGIPFLVSDAPVGLTGQELFKALWPFEVAVETLWIPFMNFGAVAVAYWVLRLFAPRAGAPRWRAPLLWMGAGALGSLWWWTSYEPWWFSLLHGAIWGGCVGIADDVSPPPARSA